jgi:REP element-mobilizing transposase RayT
MNKKTLPERPRRRSLRLRGYDYSSSGAYFVTVCIHDRKCILDDVIEGAFQPSSAGEIVKACWYELAYHYAGLALDALTIMPNHVHGVLVFLDPVGAGLKPAPTTTRRRTLSEVVRAFKTFSGRRINELRASPGLPVWQRGYYEHIVRTEKGLREIRRYILDNPKNWSRDPENRE